MSVEETTIPGVTIPAIRMPDPRSDEEMFPFVVDISPIERDQRGASVLIALAINVEMLTWMDLSGPESQDELAALFSDPFFQQLVGMAEKAANDPNRI